MGKLIPFGWLCVLAGIGAFVFHNYIHRRETAVKDWPVANALIRSSTLVKTQQASLKTSLTSTAPNRDPRYDNVDVWALNVDYTYKVNSDAFSGYRATSIDHATPVRPGETTPSADMVALANQLPAGKTVQAHYNPDNPSESYLVYMESNGNVTLLTTAWVFLILGVLLIAVPYLWK